MSWIIWKRGDELLWGPLGTFSLSGVAVSIEMWVFIQVIKFHSSLGCASEKDRQRCNFSDGKPCSATHPGVQLKHHHMDSIPSQDWSGEVSPLL